MRGGNAEHQEQYDWGLERFLDEARALATFRHPNIVRVLRYFRENGTAYIVMEYESGLSLKRWVPQNAPLSQRALLSIVYPLLDGLEAVHKTGFLHRDIKPDNIYVRADGTPVLLDFGAARRVIGQPGPDQHRQSRVSRPSSSTTRRATRARGPTSIRWAPSCTG